MRKVFVIGIGVLAVAAISAYVFLGSPQTVVAMQPAPSKEIVDGIESQKRQGETGTSNKPAADTMKEIMPELFPGGGTVAPGTGPTGGGGGGSKDKVRGPSAPIPEAPR